MVGGSGIGADRAIAIGRGRKRALKRIFKTRARGSCWVMMVSNMTNGSCGWGQPNAFGTAISYASFPSFLFLSFLFLFFFLSYLPTH
jgi:hypothetical protein